MARAVISHSLIKFIKDDEQRTYRDLDESYREEKMLYYHKYKFTTDDILRDYTPAEVRMLCERTKVRVKMNKLNAVWDAKKWMDKKKRFENKPESFVNRMLLKAHKRRMFKPYTEAEKEEYKEFVAWHTKRQNNARLDRWNKGKQAQEPPAPESSSDSESEVDMAPLTLEPELAPLDSTLHSESDESSVDVDDLSLQAVPRPAAQESMPDLNSEPNHWGHDEVKEAEGIEGKSTAAESGESPVDVDISLQTVFRPPAQKTMPDVKSEPNDDASHDEVRLAEGRAESIAAVPQTQSQSFDWQDVGLNINSEDLFVHTIVSTQNTEPDYECFGTQVVAASTQDTVESQPFI